MTDLTNAEKYTPQFGFEPGVVVEVVFSRNVAYFEPDNPYLFRFTGYSKLEIVLLEENHGNELCPYCSEIKSLRLLSGPFRHWSEDVPDWAVVCVNNGPHIQFFNKSDWAYFGNAPLENEIVTIRPWWCSKKETKNENGK